MVRLRKRSDSQRLSEAASTIRTFLVYRNSISQAVASHFVTRSSMEEFLDMMKFESLV
jgi:hypothetical protein